MVKVMVVDDALYMRYTYRRILEGAQAQIVAEAENGYQALELYPKAKPDYVILDLTMPGMSGQEVLEEIIKLDPEAKVVVISAMGQEAFIRSCMQMGAKSFLLKPFKDKVLLSTLGLDTKSE